MVWKNVYVTSTTHQRKTSHLSHVRFHIAHDRRIKDFPGWKSTIQFYMANNLHVTFSAFTSWSERRSIERTAEKEREREREREVCDRWVWMLKNLKGGGKFQHQPALVSMDQESAIFCGNADIEKVSFKYKWKPLISLQSVLKITVLKIIYYAQCSRFGFTWESAAGNIHVDLPVKQALIDKPLI